MLTVCPECTHEVSDRASACPHCGFPVAEHWAQQRAHDNAKREQATRRRTQATAVCTPCKGRGFCMFEWTRPTGEPAQGFAWCEQCHETGRVPVVRSDGGTWAVAVDHVDAFIRGDLTVDSEYVTAVDPVHEIDPPDASAD